MKILATLHLVDQTLNVIMVFVHAYLCIKAIHMLDVVRSV